LAEGRAAEAALLFTPHELRTLKRIDKKTKRRMTVQCADLDRARGFHEPFEFARFMRDVKDLTFDVMLEGKAKDLSLLKLRPDLLRYAPDVAARFGLASADADTLAADEASLEVEAIPDEVDEAA
jgi:UV DNA damage endonuclease